MYLLISIGELRYFGNDLILKYSRLINHHECKCGSLLFGVSENKKLLMELFDKMKNEYIQEVKMYEEIKHLKKVKDSTMEDIGFKIIEINCIRMSRPKSICKISEIARKSA